MCMFIDSKWFKPPINPRFSFILYTLDVPRWNTRQYGVLVGYVKTLAKIVSLRHSTTLVSFVPSFCSGSNFQSPCLLRYTSALKCHLDEEGTRWDLLYQSHFTSITSVHRPVFRSDPDSYSSLSTSVPHPRHSENTSERVLPTTTVQVHHSSTGIPVSGFEWRPITTGRLCPGSICLFTYSLSLFCPPTSPTSRFSSKSSYSFTPPVVSLLTSVTSNTVRIPSGLSPPPLLGCLRWVPVYLPFYHSTWKLNSVINDSYLRSLWS